MNRLLDFTTHSMTIVNHIMPSLSHRFDLTLSARTDSIELEKKLREARHPISEATIRLSTSIPSHWNRRSNQIRVLGCGPLCNIRKLHLWGPFSTPLTLTLLTDLLTIPAGQNLVHLSFNNMRLSGNKDHHLRFLGVLQEYYSNSLHELRISGVRFISGGNGIDDGIGRREEGDGEDIRTQLAQTLARFPRLRVIAVSGTDSTELLSLLHAPSVQLLFTSTTIQKVILFSLIFSDDDTAFVLQALADNTSVREASLGLTCGPRGGPALAQLLQHNNTLEKLWVRVPSLVEEANNHLVAEALRTANPQLLEFGLYGEKYLSCRSVDCFVEALREDNTALQELELQSSEESEELQFFLSLNRIGRHTLLQDFNNREPWVKALTEARHDLSCTFYLLSTNPTLCAL